MKKEELLNRELAFEGPTNDIYLETVLTANGDLKVREVRNKKNAVSIIPLTSDNELIMVGQYRNGIKNFTFEIPAGHIEDGESEEDAVRRELKEETGYKLIDMIKIAEAVENPAESTFTLHTYVCLVEEDGEQNLDSDESIDVNIVSFDKTFDLILKNKIVDMKTLFAISFINAFAPFKQNKKKKLFNLFKRGER